MSLTLLSPMFGPNTVVFLELLLIIPLLVVSQSAPIKVACPKDLIRLAGPSSHQSLSPEERSYISTRTEQVLPAAWTDYLTNVKSSLPSGVTLPSYVSDILSPGNTHIPHRPDFPKLGIALSGGGLRAAYFAAGVLTSLDGRNKTHPTGTNGVLQAATYLAGLSGGGWFTTALIQANFPTIPDLVFPPGAGSSSSSANSTATDNAHFGGFLTQFDLELPTEAAQPGFFESLVAELGPKHAAGFPVTLTDAWSRQIGRHFVNGTTAANILNEGTHGDGITFSGIKDVPTIKSHNQPFPIILANAVPPALSANPNNPQELGDIIPGNDVPVGSEIWEINLFETGSWDPSLGAFIPTHLLGSTPASGIGHGKQPAQCFAGFDQASFIAGISSNVWNGLNLTANFLPFLIEGELITLINTTFPGQPPVRMDSGAVPNPFKGLNPGKFSASNESFVALVDGGSNGEVAPLQPLIVKARGVDTIFAVDSVADRLDAFTNGSDLINTASRAARFGSLYPFPRVPSSPDTFVNQGLTSRPTFFGCDDAESNPYTDIPLVIYLANGAPSAKRRAQGLPGITNVPTSVTTYDAEFAQTFMDEAFVIASQGLGTDTTPGAQWSTCLACALVDRARARRGVKRNGLCTTCFANFCWDGKE